MYISASKASTGFSLLFIDTNYLNIREIFILRTHITSDIPVHIYIYILVSLRFESSRCMNILIAFDCAAINVARIRNERQNSTLSNRDDIRISRLRSAYKWPRNRYDQSMTPCQKPIPPPPPSALVSRTKRRVNLRGLATARTRNFCLDVCPACRCTYACSNIEGRIVRIEISEEL